MKSHKRYISYKKITWISALRLHTLFSTFPMLNQGTFMWYSISVQSAPISSNRLRNYLCFSPLALIAFTPHTTGSTACLRFKELQRLSWCMMQWKYSTLCSGKSLILSFINFTMPECLPVSEGAHSVVILASLSKLKPDLIKLSMTLLYKSFPVQVPLRDSIDNNSSVMSKFSSIPLIKISNCAVS